MRVATPRNRGLRHPMGLSQVSLAEQRSFNTRLHFASLHLDRPLEHISFVVLCLFSSRAEEYNLILLARRFGMRWAK